MSFEYLEQLPQEALARYNSKLKLIGLQQCPYKIKADDWVDNPSEWPSVQYPDIYHYLIKSPKLFSLEAMENYKSLESYNYYVSGWVQEIKHIKVPGVFILKCDVKPSYRTTESPHHPWVAVNNRGNVLTGHCTCMAGLGETCSHVAAMLYKIEGIIRHGLALKTPTDLPCQWNQNFVKDVEPAPISKILFYKKKFKENIKAEPKSCVESSREDKELFLKDLAEASPHSIGLSLFEDFSSPFKKHENPDDVKKLPRDFSYLYEKGNMALTPSELEIKCFEILDTLKMSQEEISYLEEATRTQSASSVWYRQRMGRITGSSFHSVLHTSIKNPAKSLIKKLLSCSFKAVNAPALLWGREKESIALEIYDLAKRNKEALSIKFLNKDDMSMHTNFEIKDVGLIIDVNRPWLGASPDACVFCSCCDVGVVEVKCPFNLKDISLNDAIMEGRFYIEYADGTYSLKKNHPYYAQTQLEIHVGGVTYCDFVVWTPKEILILKINQDIPFMQENLKKADQFWTDCILPKLLTTDPSSLEISDVKTKQLPIKNQNCICGNSSGEMVACDHCDKWYHPPCIKLKVLPSKSTWYCPTCRGLKKLS